jgi:hypothetical protein
MSEPESILGAKVRNLLQVVEQHRDRQCARLTEAANRKAHEIVTTAWREERERLHREVTRVREEVRQKLVSVEAQHQTRRRQRRQAKDQALLSHACDALRDELVQRWQDASGRQQWSASVVRQAADALLGKTWTIQHPRDWPAGERAAVARQVEELCGESPQFEPDSRLDAGLRICSPGACVDGSLDGLLHDGTDIAAQLLAKCELEPGGKP